jgi:hypothetical protein
MLSYKENVLWKYSKISSRFDSTVPSFRSGVFVTTNVEFDWSKLAGITFMDLLSDWGWITTFILGLNTYFVDI